ncbi:MAG: helix-turn-helix domain-containing protein [Hyphomicrobiaceae bacterium]
MTRIHDRPIATSVNDTCRLLGIGRTLVYQLLGSGALQSVRIGRRRLVLVASIDALLASRTGEDA